MNHRLYLSSLAVLLSFATTAAHAQELEEIIVTAQKRQQSLQDVGISVTAFTGEQIAEIGVLSFNNLTLQTPNMTYQNNGPTAYYRLRGDGTQVFSDTAETPVSFYVDDVYIGTPALHRQQIYDIERVEVLRGPQGILFGRNTTAGLVHAISRRPTETFEGYADLQLGSYSQRILQAAVSGPFSDNVRGRIALRYNEDDGWQDNTFDGGGSEFANTDVLSFRGMLEFDLGDSADLLFSASHYKEEGQNQLYGYWGAFDPNTFAPCSDDAILSLQCVNFTLVETPEPDPTKGMSERESLPNNIEFTKGLINLSWDINDNVSLESITAMIDYDRLTDEDFDSTGTGGALGNTTLQYTVEGEQFSQELRLHGQHSNFDWVLGMYYYDDDKSSTSTILELPLIFGVDGPDTVADAQTESLAFFAHGEYAFTDAFSLLAGVRNTNQEKDLDIFAAVAPVFALPDSEQYSLDDDETTWMVGANFTPNENTLLYLSASTGFKSGDFQTTLLFGDVSAAAPTDAETVTAYEGGVKWTSANGRTQINASVFSNEVEEKQTIAFINLGGVPTSRFLNVGDVDITGAEVELASQLTDNFLMRLSLGLLDTEIKTDPTTVSADGPTPDVVPLDGNELPGAPDVSFSALLRYDFPTTDAGTWSIQGEYSYMDDVFTQVTNIGPRDAVPSYGLVNLRLFWQSPGERYYGQAFVENATDEEYLEYNFSTAGFDQRNGMWGRPLWWGVRFGVSF